MQSTKSNQRKNLFFPFTYLSELLFFFWRGDPKPGSPLFFKKNFFLGDLKPDHPPARAMAETVNAVHSPKPLHSTTPPPQARDSVEASAHHLPSALKGARFIFVKHLPPYPLLLRLLPSPFASWCSPSWSGECPWTTYCRSGNATSVRCSFI